MHAKLSVIDAWLQHEDEELLYATDGHQHSSAGDGWDYWKYVPTEWTRIVRMIPYDVEILPGGTMHRVSQGILDSEVSDG